MLNHPVNSNYLLSDNATSKNKTIIVSCLFFYHMMMMMIALIFRVSVHLVNNQIVSRSLLSAS